MLEKIVKHQVEDQETHELVDELQVCFIIFHQYRP